MLHYLPLGRSLCLTLWYKHFTIDVAHLQFYMSMHKNTGNIALKWLLLHVQPPNSRVCPGWRKNGRLPSSLCPDSNTWSLVHVESMSWYKAVDNTKHGHSTEVHVVYINSKTNKQNPNQSKRASEVKFCPVHRICRISSLRLRLKI